MIEEMQKTKFHSNLNRTSMQKRWLLELRYAITPFHLDTIRLLNVHYMSTQIKYNLASILSTVETVNIYKFNLKVI